jgi:cytochrome c-type biogenesis protein CcmE
MTSSMSRLDDELAQAVAESEAAEAREPVKAEDVAPGSQGDSARSRKGNVILLAGLLAMVAAVLVLFATSFKDAAVYSKGVDELMKEQDELAGRRVTVDGELVKGTLVHRAEPCEYRFKMEKNGQRMDVRFPRCIVPDTFRDMPGMNVQVTAQGKLATAGHFEADNIMAKCPSKYEMKERAARGVKAPHVGVVGGALLPSAAKP